MRKTTEVRKMDKNELFALLDVDDGTDFQYFENFADLVECEEDIESDVIFALLEDVEMKTFAELCESFFYETQESIPGDQIDLYHLMENIKRAFIGLAEAARSGEDNALLQLSDELNRFRSWYSVDKLVECKDLSTDKKTYVAVRDALINARLEKLGSAEYAYDFSEALDYELEEFIMTYADLVAEEQE